MIDGYPLKKKLITFQIIAKIFLFWVFIALLNRRVVHEYRQSPVLDFHLRLDRIYLCSKPVSLPSYKSLKAKES